MTRSADFVRILRLGLATATCVASLTGRAGGAPVPDDVLRAAEAGQPIWVFLSDKRPPDHAVTLDGGGWISPRAARRIAVRGGPYDTYRDWPIDSEYRKALEARGLRIRTESRWLNAVSGTITHAQLDKLALLPCVQSVQPVAIYHRPPIGIPGEEITRPTSGLGKTSAFDYGNSLEQIKTIQVDELHATGLTGDSVMIGFLDTGFSLGIDALHTTKVIATWDFINNDSDVGDQDTAQMSHGTSTLSLCGGFAPGTLIGVAPDAEYALAKTEVVTSETKIEEDYWVRGLWWADSLGCDIVSSSLGYVDWYSPSQLDGNTAVTTKAADLVAERGLLVVNAAGNEGARGLIAPADGKLVLTVGASDFSGTPTGFSSRGPTADGRIKPDVMAPGQGIWVATPRDSGYTYSNGTSFATPLVAGVCALLLQKDPALKPQQVIGLLRRTATQADHPDNASGWGVVHAAEAASQPVADTASLIEAWPNPFADSVKIVTPDSGSATLRVFTVAGQPVYSSTFGGNSTVWPGTNNEGAQVASGVYLVWVQTPKREGTIKVALRRRN